MTLIAQQRFDEALQVILRDNPLPSICGRVCTHPCTDACTRAGVDDAVNLPALKRFITDYHPDYKLPEPTVPDRPERIAIIGSGPAGLVCAYRLRQQGYRPIIFEALSTAGGMLAVEPRQNQKIWLEWRWPSLACYNRYSDSGSESRNPL